MKCEFCGADLSLEAEYCASCGQLNKHAQQHVRDMKRYHGEFENTKKGVYTATKKYTQITVRMVVIAIMVIAIGLIWLLYNQAYDIRRSIKQGAASRKEEEYSIIMDNYLKEEKFREFSNFCTQKGIEYYYADGAFEKFVPMYNAVYYYLYTLDSMMDLVSIVEKEEGNERYVENVCEYLNYFYQYCDLENFSYYANAKRQENMDAIAAMNNNIEIMLQVYCGLTEEEAASLKGLSEAKRTVLIEEKMGNGQ
uniref:hypothetical protein n=1 Tax=Acetatifactor sp. TaxID=1872090 RepID=UPI0040571797